MSMKHWVAVLVACSCLAWAVWGATDADVDGLVFEEVTFAGGNVGWSKLEAEDATDPNPVLKVIHPTEMNRWMIAETHNVTWTAYGFCSTCGVKVMLYLDHYGKSQFIKTLNHGIAAYDVSYGNGTVKQNVFQWNVTMDESFGTQAYFRVVVESLEYPQVRAQSPGKFIILKDFF